MPLIQELISLDQLYHSIQGEKLLINDVDIFNEEQREIIDNIISKNYTEDNISLIPTCSCTQLKGTYYIGETCSHCKTKVTYTIENNISYLVWCKQPIGVAKFINPMILSLLDERFRVGKPTFYVIRWLINPAYTMTKELLKGSADVYHQLSSALQQHNIERSYNSFVDNFDKIMEILFTLDNKINKNNRYDDYIYTLIKNNRDKVFSEYLPFPNKFLIIFESNELGKFIDKNVINPVNVIRRLSGIDISSRTDKVKQARVAVSLIDLSLFYKEYLKKSIFGKPGLIRQHIVSTRAHFTARAVISSITVPHEYDEIHVSWMIGCSLLREHVLSKLLRRGMTYNRALEFLIEHTHIYHPDLDAIFKELIVEGSRDGKFGLPVLLNRNPTLHRGNIQRQRITVIKTNVKDQTISLGVLVLKPYSGDYDGDELNLTVIVNDAVQDELHNFNVHLSVLAMTGPNDFGGMMVYPKPIVSTLSNWLRTE